MRQVLDRFNKIVPLDSDAVETVLDRYLVARYQPALVLGNATREQVSRLEEHRAMLPGSGDPVASPGGSIPAPEQSPTWWAMSAR